MAHAVLRPSNGGKGSNGISQRTRLARLGDVYPIGESTGTVTVAGQSWDLWIGMNGDMQVYSFIAPGVMNEFIADAKEFYNHLEQTQGFPASSQNLIGESPPKLVEQEPLSSGCLGASGFMRPCSLIIW